MGKQVKTKFKIKIKSTKEILEVEDLNEISVWMDDKPLKLVPCYMINGQAIPKTDVEIYQ